MQFELLGELQSMISKLMPDDATERSYPAAGCDPVVPFLHTPVFARAPSAAPLSGPFRDRRPLPARSSSSSSSRVVGCEELVDKAVFVSAAVTFLYYDLSIIILQLQSWLEYRIYHCSRSSQSPSARPPSSSNSQGLAACSSSHGSDHSSHSETGSSSCGSGGPGSGGSSSCGSSSSNAKGPDLSLAFLQQLQATLACSVTRHIEPGHTNTGADLPTSSVYTTCQKFAACSTLALQQICRAPAAAQNARVNATHFKLVPLVSACILQNDAHSPAAELLLIMHIV